MGCTHWPEAQSWCSVADVGGCGLSVSFCLSDGCEGQSLLAVSQIGLSLSLASLFSGIGAVGPRGAVATCGRLATAAPR